jgi:glycosyltransferase involved in cell wall biosynthesis
MNVRACFFGGARYGRPLDATNKKKFAAMESCGQIFVIGFAHGLSPRVFTEHARFYLLPELPLPVLRYLELWIGGSVLALWLILRDGVRIFVAQSPYEGFAAAVVKKVAGWLGCRIALVVEVHGDFEKGFFLERSVPFSKLYRFLMARAARFSLGQADLLRAISSSTRQQLERWAPGKTIVQFPAWTDIGAFLLVGRRDKEEQGLRRILYVGVLTPLKGVHRLVNAFAPIAWEFSEARLVIVGRAQNRNYAEALRQQVCDLDLDDRVEFLHAMPQSELATWMGNAAVLVLPSSSEGLGRVIVEAMAAGTPVIGSDVGGIPDVIEDHVSGFLVPPGNERMLTERIRWILENPARARAMGRNGHTFAEQFFSTEVYLDGYRQIFRAAQTMGKSEKYAAFDF